MTVITGTPPTSPRGDDHPGNVTEPVSNDGFPGGTGPVTAAGRPAVSGDSRGPDRRTGKRSQGSGGRA